MFLPITIPRGVALTDIKRLQSHAAWYLREAARHGPAFGAKRFIRAKQRRIRLVVPTTERIDSVLRSHLEVING